MQILRTTQTWLLELASTRMRTLLLCSLVLVSGLAWADEAPVMPNAIDVQTGEFIDADTRTTYQIQGGRYFLPYGVEVLDRTLIQLQIDKAKLEAENQALKNLNTQVSNQPALTGRNALMLAGGGMVVGFVLAFLVLK